MLFLSALIKAPVDQATKLVEKLRELGVDTVDVSIVAHDVFVRESRLNYDCVFPRLWEEKQDAAYLRFGFPDSAQGRAAAYHVELNLPQIPLNLRYDEK